MKKIILLASALLFLGAGCSYIGKQKTSEQSLVPAGFSRYMSSQAGVEFLYKTRVVFPYNIKKNIFIKEVSPSKPLDPVSIALFPEGQPGYNLDILVWKKPANVIAEKFVESLVANKACKISNKQEKDHVVYSVTSDGIDEPCDRGGAWQVYNSGTVIQTNVGQDPFFGDDLEVILNSIKPL